MAAFGGRMAEIGRTVVGSDFEEEGEPEAGGRGVINHNLVEIES